ncbi:MAG TPA: prepilin-type N-terminal cleavage/methylation domain-containing protein [Sedimentisphaerales bacterium]|nr:prepilin-type N-terminal cleavage/methylation domain-containing protein [Sedimentisphaerales bacterium]
MNKAFTLVEVLIVVVILGILAAVVIPALASATTSARDSALAQDLVMLRRMVLVYKAQHLEVAPGYPGGNTNATPTEEVFLAQVTMASDRAGNTAPIGTPGFKYGPYMQRIPENPFNKLRTVRVLGNDEEFPTEADNRYGWIYKPATQEIRAGNTGTDLSGKRYFDY